MQECAKRIRGKEDCLSKALIPWLVLSLTTGYRGIEWLQDHNINRDQDFIKYEHPVKFTNNLINVKCSTDWLFYDSNGKVILNLLKVDVTTITSNSNCFRFQKNAKMNNQVVHFKSLPDHPK